MCVCVCSPALHCRRRARLLETRWRQNLDLDGGGGSAHYGTAHSSKVRDQPGGPQQLTAAAFPGPCEDGGAGGDGKWRGH